MTKNKKGLLEIAVLAVIFLVLSIQAFAGNTGFLSKLVSNVAYFAKRYIYVKLAIGVGEQGLDTLEKYLRELILMNPKLSNFNTIMKSIMIMVFCFYTPALVFLGFYLLFVSTSPRERAKAKDMFSKLFISFIFVSLAPKLLHLLLLISEELARSILFRVDPKTFGKVLHTVVKCDLSIECDPRCAGTLEFLHCVATFTEVEIGFYTFLFFMILIWGAFIFPIVLRYFIVSIFIALFPLSIFLYFFEFTKPLGRVMLEQTLIWIFMQVINALLIAAVIYSILTFSPTFMKPGPLPNLMWFIGCLMFSIVPLFVVRFFRGFLP